MKNQEPAVSDLERVKLSYSTGSQTYTPTANDDQAAKKSGDQQNSRHGSQRQPPSQG
jgi:hypothetical protein